MKVVLILWLLSGVIATWRMYHGYLKHFYERMKMSLWDTPEGMSFLKYFLYCSPIIIASGVIGLYTTETNGLIEPSWWFDSNDKN